MQPLKTYFNWSSGKDSALALHYLLKDKNYSVDLLLTTINLPHNRVSMHGVRKDLLVKQFEAIGIPYTIIELPQEPTMQEYNSIMNKSIRHLQQNNFECAAFGDIFLEDVKKYREGQLAPFNMKAIFPLWKIDTKKVMNEFINSGFRAIVVSINSTLLDKSFAGRMVDESFIKDLQANVDVCGENGEFHTFCFAGPAFKSPVQFTIGKKVYREYKAPENVEKNNFTSSKENNLGFWFCDLLPLKN